MWGNLVEVMRMLIFAYAQIFGGNLGAGILFASLTFRAVLFPLSLKFARESRQHQEAMQKIKPELDRIREKFRNQPERLHEKTKQLFEKHGIAMLPKSLLMNFAQIPLFIAFYSAVQKIAALGGRFLWVGNIAKPDLLLTTVVSAITCLAVFLSRSNQPVEHPSTGLLLVIPVVFTVAFLLKASAGVAIYFGVSSVMSVVQNQMLRRQVAT